MKKVIVFGATGNTGKQICEELDAEGLNYNVFVREQSASKIEGTIAEIITGDVMNSQDVLKAFEDPSYTDVIIALGSKDLKATKIRSIGTLNIINTLKKKELEPTIHVISALGVGESWNQLKWHAKLISNLLIKKTMNDHNEQEVIVKNSDLPYHILRPVALKDGESKGNVHVQNEGFLPTNSIQRNDLAKYLVTSLLKGKTGVSGVCNA